MADDEDDDAGREFTARERRELRRMMEADKRADWLKNTAKVWITTFAAVIGAIVAIKIGLTDLFKMLATWMATRSP